MSTQERGNGALFSYCFNAVGRGQIGGVYTIELEFPDHLHFVIIDACTQRYFQKSITNSFALMTEEGVVAGNISIQLYRLDSTANPQEFKCLNVVWVY